MYITESMKQLLNTYKTTKKFQKSKKEKGLAFSIEKGLLTFLFQDKPRLNKLELP